jgi:hypothetical protein
VAEAVNPSGNRSQESHLETQKIKNQKQNGKFKQLLILALPAYTPTPGA